MQVRKVRCPSCGAPKVTPSESAYVYCDYCGQYMDWDLQAAKYSAGVAAGPHYRALLVRLQPELTAARLAGDRARLAAGHRQIFDQYMKDCVSSYSPRIKDPAYREAILTRTVHATVVSELDPRCRATQAALDAAIAGLEYDVVGEDRYDASWNKIASAEPRPRPHTFWRMYEAYTANALAVAAALDADPQVGPDPDDTPPALAAKVRDSGIVQAWIKLLDPATADELLERTHLRDEYVEVPDPTFHDAACARCGAAIHAPEGARRHLCTGCGHLTPLGTRAFCGYCGAPVHFGLGARTAACTHCQAEMQAMTL
ncbi:MAG: hypothetical protein H6708_17805 [Kofleriaceae bacterium]|nr:hypothetical protein [Myxococcales bacterium]MCB9562263.1 hypothetical protein [Kofleriaceae bacterium]